MTNLDIEGKLSGTASRFRISTGTRLHFGLLDTVAPFGGVGVMIDQPLTEVELKPAETFHCDPAMLDRAIPIVDRIAAATGQSSRPAVALRIIRRAPAHFGFGSGTQLSMAIAEAICRGWNCRPDDHTLAYEFAGRGRRSAVGVYGYLRGGMIFEAASATTHGLNQLVHRVELPTDWRVAIVQPRQDAETVSGTIEADHFSRTAPATSAAQKRLRDLIATRLVPAASAAEFADFAATLSEYNRESGKLFAAVQGGPYNGPQVTSLIELLSESGASGVGQSSWGPSVFAWFESQASAEQFVGQLPTEVAVVTIATPRNQPRSVS